MGRRGTCSSVIDLPLLRGPQRLRWGSAPWFSTLPKTVILGGCSACGIGPSEFCGPQLDTCLTVTTKKEFFNGIILDNPSWAVSMVIGLICVL